MGYRRIDIYKEFEFSTLLQLKTLENTQNNSERNISDKLLITFKTSQLEVKLVGLYILTEISK